MKKSYKIIIFLFTFFIGINNIFASGDIKFHVSPVKYSLSGNPGDTIIRKAKLSNFTSKTMHIVTGKSDFVPNGINGTPKFIRKSELVNPDQVLSDWITIDKDEFNIEPNEVKEITFRIDIPENGTPGGHYGAVFFKNNNSGIGGGNNVVINIDYGVLILLDVLGDTITKVDVGDITIKKSAGGKYSSGIKKDECPFGDFTKSNYDNKCLDNVDDIINGIKGNDEEKNIELNSPKDKSNDNVENKKDNQSNKDSQNNEKNNSNDFNVEFEIPINNTGNTHIIPTGKIIISEIDDQGNKKEIKNIGKKIILNEKGAKIGDQIVNFLPINDELGYSVPGKRIYKIEWKGFPYKDYDEYGNPEIKFWDPSTYYTKQNIKDAGFLMFWERVEERIKTKKLEAIIDLSYTDNKGNLVEFPSAQDFEINYKEKVVVNNPYILVLISLFGIFIFFIFIIIILKKKRCIECGRRINKNMKYCPYCKKKQSKGLKIKDKNIKKKTKKNKIKEKVKTIKKSKK